MTKRATKKPSKRSATKVASVARASGARGVGAPSRRRSRAVEPSEDARFAEAVALIEAARGRAYQAVNVELVSLYWQLGEHISRKIANAEWGDGVVDELAAALAQRYPGLRGYTRRNLSLPDGHSEADLHGALVRNLGRFINELGRDFCFVGSEYPVQVGHRDFAIDLVFFHRGLTCLVAFELKVGKFEPEHLGKLSFYVEALDRDVKKPHERPSIGVLLCASKDDEVVEYALARTTSPTLVAEYQTMLPPKAVLRRKLHELYAQLAFGDDADEDRGGGALDVVARPAAPRKRASGAQAKRKGRRS